MGMFGSKGVLGEKKVKEATRGDEIKGEDVN